MSKKINTYQATATFVKSFFEAYARGIIEARRADHNTPREVKQAMVDHYGEIGQHFFDILLPNLMRLNFASIEEAQQQMEKDFTEMKAADASFVPAIPDYLRTACRSTEVYEALVEEYKRNFTWLLEGDFSAIGKNTSVYTHGQLDGAADEPMGVHLLTRIIVKAYAAGLKDGTQATGRQHSPEMSTIYALLLNYVSWLLNGDGVSIHSEDPMVLFSEACNNDQNNINTLFNTVEDTMRELAAE